MRKNWTVAAPHRPLPPSIDQSRTVTRYPVADVGGHRQRATFAHARAGRSASSLRFARDRTAIPGNPAVAVFRRAA